MEQGVRTNIKAGVATPTLPYSCACFGSPAPNHLPSSCTKIGFLARNQPHNQRVIVDTSAPLSIRDHSGGNSDGSRARTEVKLDCT